MPHEGREFQLPTADVVLVALHWEQQWKSQLKPALLSPVKFQSTCHKNKSFGGNAGKN